LSDLGRSDRNVEKTSRDSEQYDGEVFLVILFVGFVFSVLLVAALQRLGIRYTDAGPVPIVLLFLVPLLSGRAYARWRSRRAIRKHPDNDEG
jgi:hypothetical protein